MRVVRSAEKRAGQAALHAAEASIQASVQAARLDAARDGGAAREEATAAAAAARAAADITVAAERDAAEARLRSELETAQQRRDAHVAALGAAHATSLAELKAFYDATSEEAMATARALKEALHASRGREAALEAANAELADSVRRLGDSLAKTSREVDELRPDASAADKERMGAGISLARAARAEKALKNAEWELEVKTQLAEALKTERDELRAELDAGDAAGGRRLARGLSAVGTQRPPGTAPSFGSMSLGR